MNPDITEISLFAFWRNDSKILGGETTHMLPGGRVRLKGYGGMIVRPVALRDVREGCEIYAKICETYMECSRRISEAKSEANEIIADLLSP